MDNVIALNTNLSVNTFGDMPESINFGVVFEPSKAPLKKYVVNDKTGDCLDTVGNTFNCASHPEFFGRVQDTMIEELAVPDLEGATCTYNVARNTAWALMDISLPSVKVGIRTKTGFQTDVSWRAVALHGIDGSCSNQVYFGGIEYFCSNGQISGEYDRIKRKNTSGFVLDYFIKELSVARERFYEHCNRLQTWADKGTRSWEVKRMLEELITSKSKAVNMYNLYCDEVAVRGDNVYSLYSAMTNYSTYNDDRNGFNLRNTGHDTQAVSMWNREHEVAKWISSPQFSQLAA